MRVGVGTRIGGVGVGVSTRHRRPSAAGWVPVILACLAVLVCVIGAAVELTLRQHLAVLGLALAGALVVRAWYWLFPPAK